MLRNRKSWPNILLLLYVCSTDPYNHLASIRQEMQQEVDSFYRRVSEIVSELKKSHIKERRRFLARKRSTDFYPITLTSFRNVAEK